MEPKRPRRRPAPRSGRSIWRTLNSRPDGCAPTSASFTIPAIPNPGSLPCPNGRATCAPWTTARGGASSRCSRTSNRAVSALRTPRSASLTAWIASSWSWPSPSTGRSPQDSGMPSTMPLPAKKKRSRSTQESGPQPNLLVHQGPPPHRQDRPILPAAPAPLGGAAKLMDGKVTQTSYTTKTLYNLVQSDFDNDADFKNIVELRFTLGTAVNYIIIDDLNVNAAVIGGGDTTAPTF